MRGPGIGRVLLDPESRFPDSDSSRELPPYLLLSSRAARDGDKDSREEKKNNAAGFA